MDFYKSIAASAAAANTKQIRPIPDITPPISRGWTRVESANQSGQTTSLGRALYAPKVSLEDERRRRWDLRGDADCFMYEKIELLWRSSLPISWGGRSMLQYCGNSSTISTTFFSIVLVLSHLMALLVCCTYLSAEYTRSSSCTSIWGQVLQILQIGK